MASSNFSRIDKENSERHSEDKSLQARIDKEIADRENAVHSVSLVPGRVGPDPCCTILSVPSLFFISSSRQR